jgi:flagellar export protein FliJ
MDRKALSRILQIKERQRQIKRTELADADKSLEEAAAHLDSANDLGVRATGEMVNDGEIGAAELALRAQLAALAQRELVAARRRLHEREAEREACGEEVVAATQEVRVFEHLNDKARRELERERGLREQSELDELSASRKREAL